LITEKEGVFLLPLFFIMNNIHLIEHLSEFITENRLQTFHSVLKNRTRFLTVLLEEIYQPHNASAAMRTCDCFGIQDVHIIENRNAFNPNPEIAMGSSKWLSMNKNQSILDSIKNLKKNGYRIVATTPHHDAVFLNDFDLLKGKSALLFGTELTGLSEEAISMADEFIKIPMLGFTESFNISVSVAIILSNLVDRLRSSTISWELSLEEKNDILLQWLKESIQSSEKIIERYYSENNLLDNKRL
jgi:tRNA (guanosine-2'-O-)-methyltransferase